MKDYTFIYWDDWREEIIKREIPDEKDLKFSTTSKEEEQA
jgi:hypothetical protein